MCSGCGGKFAKGSLVRFTVLERESGRTVVTDLSGKGEGRGAYTCSNLDCFDRAVRKKALANRLKAAVPPDIRDDLERLLKGIE